jgi:hypothetical protein
MECVCVCVCEWYSSISKRTQNEEICQHCQSQYSQVFSQTTQLFVSELLYSFSSQSTHFILISIWFWFKSNISLCIVNKNKRQKKNQTIKTELRKENIHKLSKLSNKKASFIFKFETKQNKWQRYFDRNKLTISNFRIFELRERDKFTFEKTHLHKLQQIQISLSMREWKWVKIGVVWFCWQKSEGVDFFDKFVKCWLLFLKNLLSFYWFFLFNLSVSESK